MSEQFFSPEDVREILRLRKWTAQELADAMWISLPTIQRWMAMGCPRPGPAEKLKQLLASAKRKAVSR